MLHSNISVNNDGHLTFAGYDTVALAEEFGTPLYLLDENRLRENCRAYVAGMSAFGNGSMALYASKALSFKGVYRIVAEEGLGADVVSSGELYTALKAGFPPERIYFHGNNKTDADIRYGVESGIGGFIVDGYEELEALSRIASELGVTQDILLRLTPGIDPHTFKAVNTGSLDCQFGVPIETGQAFEFTKTALDLPGVRLKGFHCHIGSQIFDWIPFRDASDIMLRFIAEVKASLGYEAEVMNLGGGFGVRYTEADPVIDIARYIRKTAEHVKSRCAELGLTMPRVLMEPGRSIVGDAGLTLYTVGSVKTIDDDNCSNYVSVDGGMSDNPRYALYEAPYTVALASRASDPADFLCTVAGRCCESGALIQRDVYLPRPARGEILAVFVTGAYNYSMASNYNRLPRPPIVMLTADGPKVAVRRETFEDLTACDI